MYISTVDYIILLVAIGLLVVMLFLYRRTKKAMKANIKEILEEYKELKKIASGLRKGFDPHKTEESKVSSDPKTSQKEVDDYKDYQLREYIYEVRQKNKEDIDKAINKLRVEIKNDLDRTFDRIQPKQEPVISKEKEKKEEKKKLKEEVPGKIDLELSDEHLNVLYNLAEETEEVGLGILFGNYKKVFPDKDRKEFQVIVRELIENNMIRESYAAAGDFFFTVTNEGLMYIRKKMQGLL